MRRLAVLSLHTSPLSQPGSGDAGGMNVYIRELVSSLAQAGVEADVYVRRWHAELPDIVEVEPGFRVIHIEAGPVDLAKEDLPGIVDDYADGVLAHLRGDKPADALHANYWLSGVAGHRIKHELDIPLVSVFHTLARVKAETGDPEPQHRIDAEAKVIRCSDAIVANAPVEASQLENLYGADPDRIEIVPPGVVHAYFSPGDKAGARNALDLGDEPILLFVGRVQPLKGVDVAVRALAELDHTNARLLIVGGASGTEGEAEVARLQGIIAELGLDGRVEFIDPQPHHLLSTYYRAADVLVLPSRSESFGLVALEAAACGTPVVAAAVGGLRTLVNHGSTGFLVDSRSPVAYAAFIDEILGNTALAVEFSANAVEEASVYTWSTTAARLRRLYQDLTLASPVNC